MIYKLKNKFNNQFSKIAGDKTTSNEVKFDERNGRWVAIRRVVEEEYFLTEQEAQNWVAQQYILRNQLLETQQIQKTQPEKQNPVINTDTNQIPRPQQNTQVIPKPTTDKKPILQTKEQKLGLPVDSDNPNTFLPVANNKKLICKYTFKI